MLELFFKNNQAPALNADNLNRIVNEINFINERTKNAVAVVANPEGKPKKTLETIAIDGTVYKVEGGESEKYEVLKLQTGNTPTLIDVPSNTTGIYISEIREENNKKYYAGSVYIDLETKLANVCTDEVNLAIYNKYLGQYWEDSNGYIYDLRKVSDLKFEIVYYFDSYTNISAIEFNSEWTGAEINSGDYGTSALAIAYIKGSGDIGVTSWEELENKPFESLNADNFEVDEVGALSIKDDGRVAMLENEVSDLDKNKVNQLNMSTGIDISDWDRDIDPDVPVIVDKYVDYHDAVSKLSQQIDVMGNRTDDLKTSLNNLDNIVFNIANNGYNANTDRNVLENRINAIKYVINNIMKNGNGFCGAVIRYSGGYYFHYYITRVQNSEISALEIDMYSKKIRMIQINNTSGEGTVLREI